jgi:SAM-dependent methyltransferase
MALRTRSSPETHRITDLLAEEPHLGYPPHLVVSALRSTFPTNAEFSVIDAGCGFGRAACAIAEHFPHATVLAIDIEPTVIAAGEKRARRLGVTSQVRFATGRLVPEVTLSSPADALILLAAGELFRTPGTLLQWMRGVRAPGRLALVDRTAVVLPGREHYESTHFAEFRSQLGTPIHRVGSRIVPLSREASLHCVEVLLECAVLDSRRAEIANSRRRVLAGERAQVVSALYAVMPCGHC